MGRPKGSKNKSTIEKELSSQVETVDNPVDNVDKIENVEKVEVEVKLRGKQKEYRKCDRCGKEIYCEPWKIDTNMLTGKAEYWRNIPRRLSICSECAKELSDLVEKFFLEKGILKKNFEE